MIQNITALFILNQKIDLRKLALNTINIEYNPKKFTAAIMRIRNPAATALIFDTGKCICTGTKSISNCQKASRRFARIIQKIFPTIKYCGYRIKNIVGSYIFGRKIDLDSLYYSKKCQFNPETFPGLNLPLGNKQIALVFKSGRFVLTGFKSEEDIKDKHDYLKRLFLRFIY